MSTPADLKYHESHTWLKAEAGSHDVYTVGITAHAQEQLGDVVYVQPPAVGSTVKQGEACGVIESVKTAADVHAPASGVVIEINPALEDAPESVNTDPYAAWLFRMTLSDAAELNVLLDAAGYEKMLD
ncbi:MAG TPA: glycine cleavage system protein GcvH [Burkholderiales bacterium]|nr:glycine cleavage system protein GcvH [Burkholderiales bacterium]